MNAIRFSLRNAVVCAAFSLALSCSSLAQESTPAPQTPAGVAERTIRIPAGTLLQVGFDHRVNWKHPASKALRGRLSSPIYFGETIAIPNGTSLDLTVASVRKAPNSQGKWRKAGSAVVRAFDPLEKPAATEYLVELSSADIASPEGNVTASLKVLRVGRSLLIEQQKRKQEQNNESALKRDSMEKAHPGRAQSVMLLALTQDLLLPAQAADSATPQPPPAEHRLRAFLLTPLAASRARAQDTFQARTAEPVRLGDALFAAGSLIDGHVDRVKPPRILSRAGSMVLRIDRINSPQGASVPLSGTLADVETDSHTHLALDDEGILRGQRPGVMNAIVDLGIAYTVGKVTDDIAETPIRAVGAAMSDAAVANAARYFGLGASVAFLITRHGRDVVIPQYSEMGIILGRHGQESAENKTPH